MGICIYVEKRNKKSISCLGGLYFVVAETPEYSVASDAWGRLSYETSVRVLKKSFNDSADYHLLHYWDLKESYHGGFRHLLNIISRENTPSGKSVKQPDFAGYDLCNNTEFFLPGNNPDIRKVVELIDIFLEYNTWSSLQEKVVDLESKINDIENIDVLISKSDLKKREVVSLEGEIYRLEKEISLKREELNREPINFQQLNPKALNMFYCFLSFTIGIIFAYRVLL
jgi:hypothetical protein